MKNQITIGGKIGYLNLKTGKYNWVEIIGTDGENLSMREFIRQSNYGRSISEFTNEYIEKASNVIKYLKTPSIDFKDGRPLMKYKGTTKLY